MIDTLSYNEAANKHYQQFYGGMAYGKPKPRFEYAFPFGNKYLNEKFILTHVLVRDLKARVVHQELVELYSESFVNGDDIEPIWVAAGRKLADSSVVAFWHNQLDVYDGNHRALAAK